MDYYIYRIGEFSTLSKTTIKTLRYYETNQLLDLSKIISLRQIGLFIYQQVLYLIEKFKAIINSCYLVYSML